MDDTGCLIVVVSIVGIAILAAISQNQNLEKAKAAYDESLAALAADPTNTLLHQQTLELGRAYSKRTRDQKGVTLFDEVALMNDINAACGGKVGIAESVSTARATKSVEDRLQQLVALKEKGLIDDEEYRQRRARVLDDV